jgi:hypothetical protein
MKKAILTIILFLPTALFAQESGEKKWVLKLNAAQTVDFFSFPTIQVAAERKLNSWFSVNAETGYQFYDPSKRDTGFLMAKGFKTNIEGRMYLAKLINGRTESKRNEIYLGIQVFYRQNQGGNSLYYSPVNDSTKQFEDNFAFKKTAKGINLIFGYQLSAGRLVLEPFAGVGIVHRQMKNTNIEYDKSIHEIRGGYLASYIADSELEENSGNAVNICIGFRIGCRF